MKVTKKLVSHFAAPFCFIALAGGCHQDTSLLNPEKTPSNIRFHDAAKELGLTHLMSSWGLSWADVNNDDLPDLFVADHMHYNSTLFINSRYGFKRSTDNLGHAIGYDNHMGLFGDIDGDADLDLFTTAGIFRQIHLFENNGGFSSVTEKSGIGESPLGSGRGGVMADINGDGWADIYYSNSSSNDRLFINRKGKVFEESIAKSGLMNSETKYGNALADIDNDGDIDVIRITGAGIGLFVNQGNGHFVDVSRHSGIATRYGGYGSALGDIDNDGKIDIVVFNRVSHLRLLRNKGDGLFEDASYLFGLHQLNSKAESAGLADFDNDGWLDIYLTFGDEESKPGNARNRLLRNKQGQGFEDVSDAALGNHIAQGKSVNSAFADYNLDGRIDIAVINGGGNPEISGPIELLENRTGFTDEPGRCGNWIKLKLDKGHGSRSGDSPTVALQLDDGRTIKRQPSAQMRFMAQDEPLLHIGLGCAKTITSAVIFWPDGTVIHRQNISPNQIYLIQGRSFPAYNYPSPQQLIRQAELTALEPSNIQQNDIQSGSKAVQDEIKSREDEVLAYILAKQYFHQATPTEEDIAHHYENFPELYTIPSHYWIERILSGVFVHRKNPPRLPWETAKSAAQSLRKKHADAEEIAWDLNIKAWTPANRKTGKYWDMKGETRGYSESGWVTEEILRSKVGPLADQLMGLRPGQVLGPLRNKESNTVIPKDKIPKVLETIKIEAIEKPKLRPLASVKAQISSQLHQQKFITYTGAVIPGEPHGYIGNFAYPINPLAKEARALGLHKDSIVRSAFNTINQNVAADFEISNSIKKKVERYSPSLEKHPYLKEQERKVLILKEVFFAHEESARKANHILKGSQDLDQLIEQLKVPDINTRASRGASNFWRITQLRSNSPKASTFELTKINTFGLSQLKEHQDGYSVYQLLEVRNAVNTSQILSEKLRMYEMQLKINPNLDLLQAGEL